MSIEGANTKDLELELRLARVETALGVMVDITPQDGFSKYWEDTKADILGLFPESRVCG